MQGWQIAGEHVSPAGQAITADELLDGMAAMYDGDAHRSTHPQAPGMTKPGYGTARPHRQEPSSDRSIQRLGAERSHRVQGHFFGRSAPRRISLRKRILIKRSTMGALLATAGLLLCACQSRLTLGDSAYAVSVSGSKITITNPGMGGIERELLWASGQANETSATQCATWVSGQGIAQNGLAFRIAADHGGWDAIVLERNITYYAFWGFVPIYFHSGSNHTTAFDVGSGISLANYLGVSMTQDVFPLRICAQISRDDVLRFAVAKGTDPMPPLGTVGRGGTIVLNPADIPASGQTGTYIAHLPQRTSAVVDGVVIDGHPAASPLS